jgi:hypothetical protein
LSYSEQHLIYSLEKFVVYRLLFALH